MTRPSLPVWVAMVNNGRQNSMPIIARLYVVVTTDASSVWQVELWSEAAWLEPMNSKLSLAMLHQSDA